jgi:hypothetical protein
MVCWWLVPWDAINAGHWLWLGAGLATTLWSGAEYLMTMKREKEPSS